MCGRFVQAGQREEYETYLQVLAAGDRVPAIEEEPSWNIPPSSQVWVFRHLGGALRLDRMTWGWPVAEGSRLVSNARLEGASEKRMFRDAWLARRCVVPVEGWYEWQPLGDGRKQPYYFTLHSRKPVLLAGLWEDEAFVLLTCETQAGLRLVHTRRPVAVSPTEARRWCNPGVVWSQQELEAVITPEDAFEITPVSDAVNGTRRDGPELIQPIDAVRVAKADLLLPGF